MNKWTLTFLLVDTPFNSFEEAFTELKKKWEAQRGGPQVLETIWITTPTGHPMFYHEICAEADRLNLP